MSLSLFLSENSFSPRGLEIFVPVPIGGHCSNISPPPHGPLIFLEMNSKILRTGHFFTINISEDLVLARFSFPGRRLRKVCSAKAREKKQRSLKMRTAKTLKLPMTGFDKTKKRRNKTMGKFLRPLSTTPSDYRPEKCLSQLFLACLDRIITGKYSKRILMICLARYRKHLSVHRSDDTRTEFHEQNPAMNYRMKTLQ